MPNYSKHLPNRKASVSIKVPLEPIQKPNNAGGFVYPVGNWAQLERWLTIGSIGGTYYVTEQKLTEDSLAVLVACINEDPVRVVNMAIEVSNTGRALKNDQAILALAHVMAVKSVVPVIVSGKDTSSAWKIDQAKHLVRRNINVVCRTGTHILHFAAYMDALRGWGRSARTVIGAWYNSQKDGDLGYQVTKYQSRDGWSHKDLLRLSHPQPNSNVKDKIFQWITKDVIPEELAVGTTQIIGMDKINKAGETGEAIDYVRQYKLSREMIPTKFLKDKWMLRALWETMPIEALIRNLGNLSEAKLFEDTAIRSSTVERLTSIEGLKKGRVHPIKLLIALKQYEQGGGFRSDKTWPVDPRIVDGLNEAFYASMKLVEPTGQRILLALDVSSSMGHATHGTETLTAHEAGLACVLSLLNAEPNADLVLFASQLDSTIKGFSPSLRMDMARTVINKSPVYNGGTDMSLPPSYVMNNPGKYDALIFYTDSETWLGKHPQAVIDRIRQSKPNFKVIEVAATSNDNTALREDPRSLRIAGFDATVPQVVDSFLRGG